MGGPGWVMIGDAFAFLDPVFSSGVYLAMSGAEQAAKLVDSALSEPRREAGLLRKLERRNERAWHDSHFLSIGSTVRSWTGSFGGHAIFGRWSRL